MKITSRDVGIITNKLAESRDFYSRVLGFEVVFESDWYIQLRNGEIELGLLKPGRENQPPVFQQEFRGQGVWFSWGSTNVDAECKRIAGLGIPLDCPLRDEPWGERHFAVRDPNGIVINIATTIPPAAEFAQQHNNALEPASK